MAKIKRIDPYINTDIIASASAEKRQMGGVIEAKTLARVLVQQLSNYEQNIGPIPQPGD